MQQLKKAALCLHGLHEDDRSSMLSKLPESKVEKIKELLADLENMNIPANSGIMPSFDDCMTEIYEKNRNDTADLKIQVKKLDQASIYEIKPCLINESSHFVAALMSLYNWSWSSDYLKSINAKNRNEIKELSKNRSIKYPDRMKIVLIKKVNESLANSDDMPISGKIVTDSKFKSFVSKLKLGSYVNS